MSDHRTRQNTHRWLSRAIAIGTVIAYGYLSSLNVTSNGHAMGQSVVPPQPAAPQTKTADSVAVQQLKAVESKVSAVVAMNLESCVAISDGVGFGTGVVVSEDGLILTAGHVMGSGDKGKYEVIFPSGKTVAAKPLGKNLNVDAGMLQLVGEGPFPYSQLADEAALQPGDWVVSMGHSGGFELGRTPPVRVGRILRRKGETIVTDAVLIGGDSGGPLFNLNGRLIAIHTSIGDITADNRHVTLATFRRDWQRLRRGDSWGELKELNEPGDDSKPGKMGVNVDRTAPQAKIRSVSDGSAAADAGLMVGDVVLQFDDVIINDGSHLIEVVKRFRSGEIVPIKIQRGQSKMRLEIQLK